MIFILFINYKKLVINFIYIDIETIFQNSPINKIIVYSLFFTRNNKKLIIIILFDIETIPSKITRYIDNKTSYLYTFRDLNEITKG